MWQNFSKIIDPIYLFRHLGIYGLFFIIFAETGLFFGFFLPGDSLLITAGILSSQGYINIWILLIGSFIFAVYGDSFGYWLGRKMGPKIFVKENSLLFKKEYVERTQKFFEKYGNKTIFFARFVPIIRTLAPTLAGVGHMKYNKFIAYNVLGGFVWSFVMTLTGYFIGNTIPNIDRYIWYVVLVIIILSLIPLYFEWRKSKSS